MVQISLIKDFEKTSSYWDSDAVILISLYITKYASGFLEEEGFIIPDEFFIITSDMDRIYLSRNPEATPETEADYIIRTWDIHWDENKADFVSIDWTFHVMGECPGGKCSIYSCDGSDDILVFGELASIRLAAYKGQSVITIPNSVEEICADSFYCFTSLEEVIISEGVSKIGYAAFAGCENLKRIRIPESVNQIRFSAFGGCSNLAEIHLPDSVTIIENEVFLGCSSLQEFHIPDKTSLIGKKAFYGCDRLKKLWIPDSVTLIDKDAFKNCSALTEISIPLGLNVNEIGLSNNVHVSIRFNEGVRTIPNGVDVICRNAFRNCSDLNEVRISESVTMIGCSAFEGCVGLKELFIPDSVMIIDQDAFKGCSALEKISIPIGLNVTKAGIHPTTIIDIRTNDGIRNIPYGVTEIRDKAFCYCSELKGIIIPESVIKIGKEAFWGCDALKEVRLPDSVTEIKDYAFSDCSNLTEINIPKNLTVIGVRAFGRSYLGYMIMCNYPDIWLAMSGVEEDDESYDDYLTVVNIVKAAQNEPDEEMRVLTIFKNCYEEFKREDDIDEDEWFEEGCYWFEEGGNWEDFKKYISTRFHKEWYKNYIGTKKLSFDGPTNYTEEGIITDEDISNMMCGSWDDFLRYRLKVGHTERQDRFTAFMRDYPLEILDSLGNRYPMDTIPYFFYEGLAKGGDYELYGCSKEEFIDILSQNDPEEQNEEYEYAAVLEEKYGIDYAVDYINALNLNYYFYDLTDGTADFIVKIFSKAISFGDNAKSLMAIGFLAIKGGEDFARFARYFDGKNVSDLSIEMYSRLSAMWKRGLIGDDWLTDELCFGGLAFVIDWEWGDWHWEEEDYPECPDEDTYRLWLMKLLESDFTNEIADYMKPLLELVLEKEKNHNWENGRKAIESFLAKTTNKYLNG